MTLQDLSRLDLRTLDATLAASEAQRISLDKKQIRLQWIDNLAFVALLLATLGVAASGFLLAYRIPGLSEASGELKLLTIAGLSAVAVFGSVKTMGAYFEYSVKKVAAVSLRSHELQGLIQRIKLESHSRKGERAALDELEAIDQACSALSASRQGAAMRI